MGYDLRMPAAFKALQRKRPPDEFQDPSHAPSVTSHVCEANYLDPSHRSYTSSSADVKEDEHASFSVPAVPSLNKEGDLTPSSSRPSSPVSSPPPVSLAPPTPPPSLPQQLDFQDRRREAEREDQLGVYTKAGRYGPRQNLETLSRGDSDAAVPTETSSWAGNPRLKFAASAPSLVPNGTHASAATPKLLALSSTSSFSSGIDRYGFKKPNLYTSENDFDAWSETYSKYIAHREKKWEAFLKAHGLSTENSENIPVRFPPESQRLRRYVRKGIPPKWRGNAWFWFARGHEKLNARPGLYQKYVEETLRLRNSDTEHIERDLHRTFPDNIYFRNDPITNEESEHLRALRRVLRAFSLYQPKIGYCQSLNFIAGNLLLFMDEERAFWMLVIITQNYLAGLHEVNLEQVNTSQGVLMISVRDRLPKIWSALNLEQSLEDNFISNLPPISLCTAPWFMSLMVNVLPTETMLRVWDCFFLEGPKTLYRVSLTIFKLVEPQMSKAADELEVFQIIQSAPRKLFDPEVLMKACFKRANGFGHISNEDIALLRSFVQSRRKQAMEGVEQTLNDRHAYAKLYRGRRVRAKLSLYR